MAGGPIFPRSAYPTTSNAFPYVYIGAGANSKHEEVLGVAASLAADTIWRLRFQMPPTLPTGTGKLRLLLLANATSGNAKINPKWVSVAVEENASSATPVAETVQTVTWAASDNDQYKELKVTLDADTLVESEEVVMDLTFETASWTLAQILGVIPSIIWE